MFNIVHNFIKIDQYSGVFWGNLKDIPTIFKQQKLCRPFRRTEDKSQ